MVKYGEIIDFEAMEESLSSILSEIDADDVRLLLSECSECPESKLRDDRERMIEICLENLRCSQYCPSSKSALAVHYHSISTGTVLFSDVVPHYEGCALPHKCD